ncbi:hypothetical protein [Thalassospira alkalitolerans]|uniref:hypothetical protein n=1 Tax=Thalassospira alkalitolerans TaxID=1293890 RepID=UPI003AA7EF9B
MIPEYENILSSIKPPLTAVGFCLIDNSDFLAEFETTDGWKIKFEGERYYRPLIEISITPPEEDDGYSVRILMECFWEVKGGKSTPPTAVNQANFVKEHLRGWISKKENYEIYYKKKERSYWRIVTYIETEEHRKKQYKGDCHLY